MESEEVESNPLEVEMDVVGPVEIDEFKRNGPLITLPAKFYYLDVHLEFVNKSIKMPPLTGDQIKVATMNSIRTLFGEFGAAIPIDILSVDSSKSRIIIRCPSSFYVKLRSALTLATSLERHECYWQVVKASPCLLSLASNTLLFRQSQSN